jgi:putative mRNA 3-end processing factor
VNVRLRDGIEIPFGDGETFVADATRPAGDVNFVSHAHGDHLYDAPPESVLWSETTAELAAVRRADEPVPAGGGHPDVRLFPAGHIPGSRAALLEDGDRRILYTGDVSTRDRFFLSGFEPVEADVLVVEATYGRPTYEFPAQADAEARIVEWLQETRPTPLVLFGYTLGRAQELQRLVERSRRDGLYVSTAIAEINAVLERCHDLGFEAEVYDDEVDLGPDDVLVLPSQTTRLAFVDAIVEATDAITAAFSGWAVDDSYRFQAGVDAAFPLSDHCDFPELLDLVAAVDPETVYTQHGFADDLATEIRSRLGIEARALKRNQSTLGDF